MMVRKYQSPPPGWVPTTTIKCCVCNIVFAVSDIWHERRILGHGTFFCPDGHAQHCTGKVDPKTSRYDQKLGAYPGKAGA
jgi:hypothetical protein